MKKAKNEAAAEMNEKNTQRRRKIRTESEKNIPSDKVRDKEKENAADEFPFKKVLYGYEPEEVSAYIKELNESQAKASRIHESKLSTMKEELVLSNRERDSYRDKYRACKQNLEALSAKPEDNEKEDKTAEYEAVIAGLRNELERVKIENSQLKQLADKKADEAIEGYVAKIASLETEKKQISIMMDSLKNENADLAGYSEKYNALFEERKEILGKLELSKAQTASKEAEILQIHETLEAKKAKIKELEEAAEKREKKTAELEVKYSVLKKQIPEKDEEIATLKDVNKTQAYDYTDKINALEKAQAKANLSMQKKLQLHSYHVSQVELTIAEITKLMEQMKSSLNDMQIL